MGDEVVSSSAVIAHLPQRIQPCPELPVDGREAPVIGHRLIHPPGGGQGRLAQRRRQQLGVQIAVDGLLDRATTRHRSLPLVAQWTERPLKGVLVRLVDEPVRGARAAVLPTLGL
jgi:hypothetical protein